MKQKVKDLKKETLFTNDISRKAEIIHTARSIRSQNELTNLTQRSYSIDNLNTYMSDSARDAKTRFEDNEFDETLKDTLQDFTFTPRTEKYANLISRLKLNRSENSLTTTRLISEKIQLNENIAEYDQQVFTKIANE